MKHGFSLSKHSESNGFTLIEMIISVTLMLLLLGVTVGGYTSYNNKQKVKQAALTLKSDLRMARTNAMSGKKPLACTSTETLIGYEVSFTLSSYTITPRCRDSGLIIGEKITVTLPAGIYFSPIPSTTLTYYPLTKGVSGVPNSIGLTDDTNPITLTIDSTTGEVSD